MILFNRAFWSISLAMSILPFWLCLLGKVGKREESDDQIQSFGLREKVKLLYTSFPLCWNLSNSILIGCI